MSPSLDYFLPYQVAWLNEPASMAFGEKSRRIGWTYTQAYRAVEDRVKGAGDYWHSSADMTASVEFIEDCRMWAEIYKVAAKVVEAEEVIDDEKITTIQLRFANGTKIVGGSSNPKFFRSKGGDAGLDEFAFHARGRELLKAAQATAIFWGHKLRIWSTHNGEGSYFNQLLKQVRSGQLRAKIHRVTVIDAVEQGLVEKIRKLKSRDDKARREWLDELRSTCADEDSWNEEYMCVPGSGQSSLLSYDLIQGCERNADELPVVDDPRELKTNAPMYYGLDIGRQRDLSVFWGLAKVGDVYETRLVKRFAKTPYHVQEDFLNLCLSSSNARRLCGDETGIGNMMMERAIQRWGKHRVEGLTFTGNVKADLAMPLVRLFEDKLVRVPAEAETRESLHKVRKIVTTAGNVRFDAKHDESGHADEFWALALAYHGADAVKIPMPRPLMSKPLGL